MFCISLFIVFNLIRIRYQKNSENISFFNRLCARVFDGAFAKDAKLIFKKRLVSEYVVATVDNLRSGSGVDKEDSFIWALPVVIRV